MHIRNPRRQESWVSYLPDDAIVVSCTDCRGTIIVKFPKGVKLPEGAQHIAGRIKGLPYCSGCLRIGPGGVSGLSGGASGLREDMGPGMEGALRRSEDRRNPPSKEDMCTCFEQNPRTSPKIAGKIIVGWLNENFTEKMGGDPPYILMSSKKYFGNMPMGADNARFVILGDVNFEYFLDPEVDMLAAQEQAADLPPKKLQKLGREFSALCKKLGYSWDFWSSNVLIFSY
jgi:hypothetical protein